jgi:serine protease AprX
MNTQLSGKGLKVAVLDSEVNGDHPALKGRVHRMRNFSDEDWGIPGSHGTAVAGIIAGKHDKHSGMAPDAIIYSYKFPPYPTEDFFGALALQQALIDQAHIANCSWGTSALTDGTSREVRACNNAWACGMTIVKSAGNDGPDNYSVTCPADAEGIIVVGATDRRGRRVVEKSSRGPALNEKQCPDLVAPGGENSDPIFTCRYDGGFGISGVGTSFAAAHVTGLLCLLLAAEPNLTPDKLRDRLLKSCNELEGDVDANGQGRGLINLAKVG